MQRIGGLAIFAKVGELGSISAASRSLRLPKANVSRAVARLEADYGVALIERSTRKITLTEIGRKLHERCQRLLAEVEGADAEIAEYRGAPAGKLRVGLQSSVASYLAPYFVDFLARHPAIDLRLRIAEGILPGSTGVDVLVHSGWLTDSLLKARKLCVIPTILVASARYIAARGVPKNPDDLRSHIVLGYQGYGDPTVQKSRLTDRMPPIEISRGRKRHTIEPCSRLASNDHNLALDFVRRGCGIAPLGTVQVETEIDAGTLVRVLPSYSIVEPATLYAIRTNSATTPPKVRVFVDFLAEITRKGMKIHPRDRSGAVPPFITQSR